jgi:hypothetical protein
MNDFERRIRQLINPISTRVTQWWCNSSIRTAWERRSEGTQRAATAVKDLRDSDAAKRAATAVKDWRDSDAGKRAATALKDLRDSDAGKRAATALTDLRQRESVRKAEESAKRAMHDLRSGHGSGSKAS